MKPFLKIVYVLFLLPGFCFSQSIGINTSTPDPSAVLDISHPAKGLLIPRMSGTGITAISSPAKGLMVYDSSSNQLMVNMGTATSPDWENIVTNSGWTLTGNAGTDTSRNFIGTTDFTPLLFKISNVHSGLLDPVSSNTAFGYNALAALTTGSSNTAIGSSALTSNTSGIINTACGANALYSNTTGLENTAVGYGALFANSVGNANTAVGIQALGQNTVGNDNVAIGSFSLKANTYGNYNTAIGTSALQYTTGAFYNTVVGVNSGASWDLGYNNTILGANCDGSFPGQYNIIAIGQGVTCTDNSQARFGNSATSSIGGYADWTNISDGRYKKNIQENVVGLDFIMKLRPVTYNLNVTALSQRLNENRGKEPVPVMKKAMADRERVVETGFIAQEVEQAAKISGYAFSGVDKPETDAGLYGLRYSKFVVPLVKAVQEQQQMIMDMNNKLDQLEARLQSLQQPIAKKR